MTAHPFYFILYALLLILPPAAGFMLWRKNQQIAIIAGLVGLFVSGAEILFLIYPSYEVQWFQAPWYIHFKGWGYAGALLYAGMAAAKLKKPLKIFLSLCIILFIIHRLHEWNLAFSPPNLNFTENGFKNKVCLQSVPWSCVPASCATLLKVYGIDTTEKEMILSCLTSDKSGSGYLNAAAGLRRKTPGHTALFLKKADTLSDIKTPCITAIELYPGVLHMVTVLSIEDGRVIIGDPLYGIRRIPEDVFLQQWQHTILWLEDSKF